MNKDKIYKFLLQIDDSFPEKLSDRVVLEDFAEKISNKAEVFTEIDNDQIVGMVAGYINDTETKVSYINIVGVLEEYRGKGISQKLLKEFIDASREKDFEIIKLEVEKDNKSAIKIYKRLGFVEEKVTNKIHMMCKVKEENE